MDAIDEQNTVYTEELTAIKGTMNNSLTGKNRYYEHCILYLRDICQRFETGCGTRNRFIETLEGIEPTALR